MNPNCRLIIIAAFGILHCGQSAAQTEPHALLPNIEFGCQFHAADYFGNQSKATDEQVLEQYRGDMMEIERLETELIRLDIANGIWDEDRARLLLDMAKASHETGALEEANDLFAEALYNIRINHGVFSLDQLPVIFRAMEMNTGADDQFFDELGDRARFIYEKAFTEETEIPELIVGYTRLYELRTRAANLGGPQSSIQSNKARELGKAIVQLAQQFFNSTNPELRSKQLSATAFYTRYDDYGKPVLTPQPGIDQVTVTTGQLLETVQRNLNAFRASSEDAYAHEARDQLQALLANFNELSWVDQAATLDFYADYFLVTENFPAAKDAYERLLNIPVLRPDYQLRALRALGQLHEHSHAWRDATEFYNCWQTLSGKRDARVSAGLAQAYYKLNAYAPAIANIKIYLELLSENNQIADRNWYLLLRELYNETNNFDEAAEITATLSTLKN